MVLLVSCILSFFVFADLADDAAGAGDPLKGLGILVVKANVILDGLGQITNAKKGPTANLFTRDFSKPVFDLIEPRRTGNILSCTGQRRSK